METLKLTYLRNGKEEVAETECCDIPFETTQKLLEVVNLDFKDLIQEGKKNLLAYLDLVQKVGGAINEISAVILYIFPQLTADDLKKCSTKEITKVACKAILFTLVDCFGELKNELTAK